MAEYDPLATQHDIVGDVAAELAVVGFAKAEEIGRGGFGVVYRCSQPSLDRTVAVKVLRERIAGDAAVVDRFFREARAAARVNHPNLIHIYFVGREGDRPFVPGPTGRRSSSGTSCGESIAVRQSTVTSMSSGSPLDRNWPPTSVPQPPRWT